MSKEQERKAGRVTERFFKSYIVWLALNLYTVLLRLVRLSQIAQNMGVGGENLPSISAEMTAANNGN